jgi:predicted oxidoreductase (fatty acid repression mutant protein)
MAYNKYFIMDRKTTATVTFSVPNAWKIKAQIVLLWHVHPN